VRGVVTAALMSLVKRQVQLGRVPLKDHEPDRIC
jgi:hypothetical protein